MKVILSLLVFTISAAVSAQQKDLFNIDDYLKKKTADAFVLPVPPQAVKPPPLQPSTTVLPAQPLTYTLSNNDVVHYGNGTMPCVKPDMRQFPNLSNAGEAGKEMLLNGPMPNGAVKRR